MRPALALWANDFRNTVRDKTVNILLFVPFILAVFLRFAVPAGQRLFPVVETYRPLIVAMFCMVAGLFPAFMQSFIMLDEKDESLFPVFRVLPLSPQRFVLYRLVFVFGLSFVYPIIIILGSGLLELSLPSVLGLSLLCALAAPVATLLIVSFAKNKIEGLTILKLLYVLVIVPLVGVAVEAPWKVLFKAVPTYWIYAAFAALDSTAFRSAAGVALGIHAVLLAWSYRQFRRRVFP